MDTDFLLNEKRELILKNEDIADIFNEYFRSIVDLVDLHNGETDVNDLGLNDSNQDYLDINIHKYEKQPSIQMIKQKFRIAKKFSF